MKIIDVIRKFHSQDSQRGLALIIAIMIISIMVIFTSDLILNSQVNLEATIGIRDRVRAEYVARSGQNMGAFLIAVDSAVDEAKSKMMQVPASDGFSDAWNMMNGLPIGGDTAELLTVMTKSFGLSAVQDEELIAQLSEIEGNFVLDISDESAKINLNFAAQGRAEEVQAMLNALMSCPAEKDFLAQKKIKSEEIFFRIKDWLDDDKTAESGSGFGDESDPYRKSNPPYVAKNAPFDTLSELLMIEGWDQEMYVVFSPYLTVYPVMTDPKQKPKLNLNTLPKAALSCLFPKADTDCVDKLDEAYRLQAEENQDLLSDNSKLSEVLKNVFCATPKDIRDKSSWFSNQSNLFRIKSVGTVGNYQKTIESVYHRNAPVKSNVVGDAAGNSTKTAILFWKSL